GALLHGDHRRGGSHHGRRPYQPDRDLRRGNRRALPCGCPHRRFAHPHRKAGARAGAGRRDLPITRVTPVVLKLGGSLAESGRLRVLLALVSRARRSVVVVPGGGAFADAVRETQHALGFSDEAAHDMALLAMHQMADAMIALEPRLMGAETLIGIARAWHRRRIPVWLPASLCAGDRLIPRDWSITSDGLAARLAERLGDVELVLVKSRTVR